MWHPSLPIQQEDPREGIIIGSGSMQNESSVIPNTTGRSRKGIVIESGSTQNESKAELVVQSQMKICVDVLDFDVLVV